MPSSPLGDPISSLTEATSLDGTETAAVVQNTKTKRSLLSTIADYVIQTATSFAQSGSAPRTRTAEDKLREWKSVLDIAVAPDSDDFATAIADYACVLVPGDTTYTLASDVTVTYGTTVLVMPGAVLSGAGSLLEEGGRVIYMDEEAPLMFDDFTGNGAITGRTPTFGTNTWVKSGAGDASTSGGELTSNGSNVYCIQDMDETPWELSGVFEITTTTVSVTMAFIRDFPGDALDDMWHVSLNLTSGTGRIRGSYWKNTATDQTPQMTSETEEVTLAAGTKYRMRAIVDGKWSYASIETLAGAVLYSVAYYEDEIPNVVGPYAFWQIGSAGSDLVWHEASARAKPTRNTPRGSYATFQAGIGGTPIGLNNPAPIHTNSLAVGMRARPRANALSVHFSGTQYPIISSENIPRIRLKATANAFQQSLDFEQFGGAVSRVYSAGNANDIRIETNGLDRFVSPFATASPDYFVRGYVLTGGSSGQVVSGDKISADKGDAAATLTFGTSEKTSIWSTELSADRAVTLATSGVPNGAELEILRPAAGAFNLNVGTGPLYALATGEACRVKFNGTAWIAVQKWTI
jgi:hypothetical protein